MKANSLNKALLLLLACAAPAPAAQPQATTTPSVTLSAESGTQLKVTVEIADDAAERQHGLMQRAHLDENAGMLFLFPGEARQSFWMKDTLIPLDMIFIRSDMTIAGIVRNAEPMTLTSRSVATPSQFVLEVNGGYTERHQIKAGSLVKFDGVELKSIR